MKVSIPHKDITPFCIESFGCSLELQRLAGPFVELARNLIRILLGVYRK